MNVLQNTMKKPTYIFPCIFHPQSKLVLVCRSKTERWANELAENKRIMYIYFFQRERESKASTLTKLSWSQATSCFVHEKGEYGGGVSTLDDNALSFAIILLDE